MMRLAAMHTWPQLPKRLATAAFTAASMSASASTMKASEPPSSSTHFFSAAPAWEAIAAPAPTLPVTAMEAMRSSAMALETSGGSTFSTSNTPSGRPASRQACCSW
ncbi:hypothetical protein D9M69_324830 [compost metagenome]